jgi:hypothetical protein
MERLPVRARLRRADERGDLPDALRSLDLPRPPCRLPSFAARWAWWSDEVPALRPRYVRGEGLAAELALLERALAERRPGR